MEVKHVTLTMDERRALHRVLWQGRDFDQFRHAFVVHFAAMGLSVEKIAQLSRYEPPTVCAIVDAFRMQGLDYIKKIEADPSAVVGPHGTDGLEPDLPLSNWVALDRLPHDGEQ